MSKVKTTIIIPKILASFARKILSTRGKGILRENR